MITWVVKNKTLEWVCIPMIFYNIGSEKHTKNWKWVEKKRPCLDEIKITESNFTFKMQA